MSAEPAPLLTAEMAREASICWAEWADDQETNPENYATVESALDALADGRTACVRVMSEAEIREWFDEWVETAGAHGHRIGAVLAFARANKLVKP